MNCSVPMQGKSMTAIVRYIRNSTVPLVTCLFLLTSPASAWEFSQVEEDWGPTCAVTGSHSRGTVTIFSSQDNFNPVLLVSLPKYPKNSQIIPVVLRPDNGPQASVVGMIDDYFGQVYVSIKRSHIDSFMSARLMNIEITGDTGVSVSLAGSSLVFKKFLRCAGSPTTTTKAKSVAPYLVGKYIHKPVKNDWHVGSINRVGGQLRWTNKAAISWSLHWDPAKPDSLATGTDNPYFAKYPSAREFKLLRKKGKIIGFKFGAMTYTRTGENKTSTNSQDGSSSTAVDPDLLGGMRLLPGYKHQPLQGIDSIVGRISKAGGLEIGYEIGRVHKPGEPRTGGSFSDRPKLVPRNQVHWYREQVVNRQEIHMAYLKDNLLLVSYPKNGLNISVTVRTSAQMAEALLMILTYPNPPGQSIGDGWITLFEEKVEQYGNSWSGKSVLVESGQADAYIKGVGKTVGFDGILSINCADGSGHYWKAASIWGKNAKANRIKETVPHDVIVNARNSFCK